MKELIGMFFSRCLFISQIVCIQMGLFEFLVKENDKSIITVIIFIILASNQWLMIKGETNA